MLCYFFLTKNGEDPYVIMAYVGIMVFMLAIIIYLIFSELNYQKIIPHIVKTAIFSLAVGVIMFAGLSICIFAIDSILFHIKDVQNWYGVLACFIFEVVALNLFLSQIPLQKDEIKTPKLFKYLVPNLAMPVYLILIFILYLYLGKVIINLSFPSGQLNWFASYASLFFIFFQFSLRQYSDENKLVKMFLNYSGYAMIPIIIMQSIAICAFKRSFFISLVPGLTRSPI